MEPLQLCAVALRVFVVCNREYSQWLFVKIAGAAQPAVSIRLCGCAGVHGHVLDHGGAAAAILPHGCLRAGRLQRAQEHTHASIHRGILEAGVA